jgi:signal transduction histidine kinase/ligand-binding sensor domain-containing protein
MKKGFKCIFHISSVALQTRECCGFLLLKIKKSFVLHFLFFILTFASFSQSLVYENYTVNDGLCGQTVNCSYQDSKGFMWFATDAGVSRFDGVHFQNFNKQNGLGDDEVLNIKEDTHGRIWFLPTNGKISYLLNNSFHNPSNDTLASNASDPSGLFDCYEDNAENMWFSTCSGRIIRIDKSGNVKKYMLPDVTEENYLLSFYETPDHELWIIDKKSFFVFTKENFILLSGPILKRSAGLPYYFISKGNALFLSDNGLERLINKNYGIIIPAVKIPFSDKVIRLNYTPRNDIWITNQNDQTLYFKYDNGYYLPYRIYLKGNAITSVYTDREENTWFCSAGNGVFKLPAQSFSNRSFTVEDGLSYNNVTAVKLGNDSSLWLGFINGTVNRIKQNSTELFDCNFNGENNNRILQIETDKDNNIWVATTDGLTLIKKINEKKYAPPFYVKIEKNKNPYSCKALSCDASGMVTVSWSTGIGNILYTESGYKIVPLKEGTLCKQIFTHYIDKNNNLWISTSDGLFLKTEDTLINYANVDARLKDRITSIREASDHTIVLATYGNGILFLKNGKVINHVNTETGLSGSVCKNIFIVGDTIYVATDKGLSIFHYSQSVINMPGNYTTSDGLLSNSVNDVAVYFNTINIATSQGLSMLPASLNRSYTEPPTAYITSFKVNSTLMDSLNNNKLNYDRQHLQFSFVAPTFDHPELLTYEYKLSGLNESWVETKNNTVEFSALDPGAYAFQLRAKKYNSDWSKPEVLRFEIISPFWETLWFRLIVANTLILIFYIILTNIVSRKYRIQLASYEQQRALQVERNRISTDMHDDLGAELTNIVILSKIAKKTLRLTEDQNSNIIDKIGVAANDIINKMNEIIWALNPANDTLSNLVSYLHRYSKEYLDLNNIAVDIDIPHEIPDISLKAAYRRNIFLVLKECLHNIVKHADTKVVRIKIDIEKPQNYLHLSIQDEGKGFSIDERTGTGNGLINMQKRMNEIKGTINMVSSADNGTKVNVKVPL